MTTPDPTINDNLVTFAFPEITFVYMKPDHVGLNYLNFVSSSICLSTLGGMCYDIIETHVTKHMTPHMQYNYGDALFIFLFNQHYYESVVHQWCHDIYGDDEAEGKGLFPAVQFYTDVPAAEYELRLDRLIEVIQAMTKMSVPDRKAAIETIVHQHKLRKALNDF